MLKLNMNTISMVIISGFFLIKGLKAQSEGSSFSKMPFVKLDGDMIKATTVLNILQCCWKCDRLPECLSLNVAHLPDKDGLYECQMLSTDSTKCSGLLKPSQHYHHFKRFTDQCGMSRCQNGASCESIGLNDFRCHCFRGFTGDLCNIPAKMYKWLKINSSPVCFGAKGSSFGRFYIKKNGTVSTVKVVHLSGYVTCYTGEALAQSNWGCAPYGAFQDRMMTIITDGRDQKILPQDEFIKNFNDLTYEIPGLSSTSPKLVFQNFTTSMDVTAGQEYRIWYGQDLKNYSDDNNGGTSCADVYMQGLF